MSMVTLAQTNNFDIFIAGEGWGDGFGADVTITNTSQEIIDGWQLEFDSFHNINSLWNAQFTKSKNADGSYHYVVTNPDWKPKLAPGESFSFGFNAYAADGLPVDGKLDPHNFNNFVFNGGLNSGGGTGGNPIDSTGESASTPTPAPTSTPEPVSTPATTPTETPPNLPNNTGAVWGNHFFAPYVDMTLYPTPDLDGISRQTGVKLFTLGFVQSDGQGPAWAGLPALGLGSNHEQFQVLGREINELRAIGGDVMLSMGGAAGVSLAQTLLAKNLSAAQLKDTYLNVVNEYGLSHLDFDIEGQAIASPQSIKLRSEAIALLQQEKPNLHIWYTLPALPSGLTAEGLNVVREALAAGVHLDGINIMAMDYGDAAAPPQAASMGDYAIRAAENTYSQLTELYAHFGRTIGWENIGVTPMIGVNDVTTEVFKPGDAQQLLTFAEQKGLGMLSMWSINRDQPASTGQVGQVGFNHSGLSDNSYTFADVFQNYGDGTASVPPTGTPSTGGQPPSSTSEPTTIPPAAPTPKPDPASPPVTGNGDLYRGTDGQQDVFDFTWNWGKQAVIENFNPSEDVISLKGFGTDYSSFDIRNDANGTAVIIDLTNLNKETITLQGVSIAQLSSSNITGVSGQSPLTGNSGGGNNPGGGPQNPPLPTLPTISIDNVSLLEGNSATSYAIFTLTLSAASNQPVTLKYATADGTATAGSDYIATNGTITFNPGQTSQTISVTVKGDTVVEPGESFFVRLSDSTNGTFANSEGTGTIINDDLNTSSGGNSSPVVGAYYPEWAIYDRNYQVADIPADKLTHVFYAFAKIDSNGEVSVFDSWAATDKRFDGNWNTPKAFAGNFEQLLNLKAAHPHLNTLISIGGWTLSDKFSDVASTNASREKFAKSAVNFMTTYGFNGIDIDWEYPVSGGLSTNTYRWEDKHNYTLLLQQLDEQLRIQEAQDNQDYLLTIASPAGADKLANFELAEMSQYLDFFNVMAYDYHGAWENTTNHNAPLYANPNDPSPGSSQDNVDATIAYYLHSGVPADKLIMGAPLYGRTWTGVGSSNDGLFQSATGAGAGTWEPGMIDYSDLYNKLQTDSNYVRHWDGAAQVPYVYNAATGFFSTYEDPQSLGMKLDYVQNNGLGGMFFWEASGDLSSNHPDSLINQAATHLGV